MRGGCDLVQDCRHSPACGVAQRVHLDAGLEQCSDEAMHGSRIADDRGAELEALAHAHHRYPVLTDWAGHHHHITGPCSIRPDIEPVAQHTDTGRGDVHAVTATPVDDLGVAGHHRHPGRPCGISHRGRDASKVIERHPFLDDECSGQVQRHGTGAGEIVDGAVYSQRTDVAPGEEQRGHHIGIGGQRQARAVDRDDGRVAQSVEHVVVQRRHEHLCHQLGGQATATSMPHHHFAPTGDWRRARPARRIERIVGGTEVSHHPPPPDDE